jgi:hypothetical protein
MTVIDSSFDNDFDKKLILSSNSSFYSSFNKNIETFRMDSGLDLTIYKDWICWG